MTSYHSVPPAAPNGSLRQLREITVAPFYTYPEYTPTRIKRLVRCTICFSKTTTMHDLVLGLFINRYEFGVAI